MSRWTYFEATDVHVDAVLAQMSGKLNSLKWGEANTAKFDASDMSRNTDDPTHSWPPKEGIARGLVVWFTDAPDATPERVFDPSKLGATWSMYSWQTDHDYTSMYEGLVRAMQSARLPDGRPLPQASAWHSRIAFTNMLHGTSTLTIYFRT
jgi:hypothetical protein